MGFLQGKMRSMNFVDVSIQFPVEVSEEDPNPDSNIVPKERPNHPRLEQMWVIIWSRPSGIVLNKQAGMVRGELGKALESIERHVPGRPSLSNYVVVPCAFMLINCRQIQWKRRKDNNHGQHTCGCIRE